ncbi:MAG: hypothetical protein AB7U25_26230 [Vicinamibacterales bacterium]
MNVREILERVVEALDTVDGLDAHPHRMSTVVAGGNDVAAVRLGPAGIEYQAALRGGLAELEVVVELNVQASDDAAAYLRMADLLSGGTGEERSVIDALEAAYLADQPSGPLAGAAVLTASEPRFEEATAGTPRLLVSDITLYVPISRS